MKIGFIGTGNMGQAILEGFIVSEKVKKEDIFIYDPDQLKLDMLITKYGVNTAENENKLAESSELIILAVKPNIYDKILDKIKSSIDGKKIVLTVAAGYSVDRAAKNRAIVQLGQLYYDADHLKDLLGW